MSFLTTGRVIATGHFTTPHTGSVAGYDYGTQFTESFVASAAAAAGEWVFVFVADDETPTPVGGSLTVPEWFVTQIDHAAFSSGFGSYPYAQQQLGSFNAPVSGGPQINGTYLEKLAGPIAIGSTFTAHWIHYNPNATPSASTVNARTYMVVAFQSVPQIQAGGPPFAGAGPYDAGNDDEENASANSSSPSVTAPASGRGLNAFTYPGSKPRKGWSFAEFAAFVWADGSTTITDPAAPWELVGKHVVSGEHGIALYALADVANSTSDYTCSPTLSGSVAWSASISDWLTSNAQIGLNAWQRF